MGKAPASFLLRGLCASTHVTTIAAWLALGWWSTQATPQRTVLHHLQFDNRSLSSPRTLARDWASLVALDRHSRRGEDAGNRRLSTSQFKLLGIRSLLLWHRCFNGLPRFPPPSFRQATHQSGDRRMRERFTSLRDSSSHCLDVWRGNIAWAATRFRNRSRHC